MTDAPRTNVCVVGVGLIGGSLGLALRAKNRRAYSIIGWGRTRSKLRTAQRMGAIDRFETDAQRALADADIVVMCVPVHRIVPQLTALAPFLKRGAIVSDVGSVKKTLIQDAKKALKNRPDVSFVGAHPIAGSEKTGVVNANADLFKNAVCVLTSDGAKPPALKKINTLWKNAGARCLTMSAAEHDRWLALTSHLPHLLAFSLFANVAESATSHPIIKSLVAGSFRDMTRIAGADPDLWAGVMQTNRSEIQRAVRRAVATLSKLSRAPMSSLRPTLANLQRAKQKWPTPR